jgi:hypothetical protein
MGENGAIGKTVDNPAFLSGVNPANVLDDASNTHACKLSAAILLNIFKRKQSVIMTHSGQGFEGALMVKIQGRGSIHA